MTRQNLHIHSTHCDGIDTPAELIQAAIAQGFDSIGFSGHAVTGFSKEYWRPLSATAVYREDVRRLQEEYRGRFPVFCGMEFDLYSEDTPYGWDYVIGSVHYLKKDGQLWGFDRSQQVVADLIRDVFGGDGMAYAKLYYETLAQLPQYGTFDILGHPDIICKHSESVQFFDEDSRDYRHAASEALEALAEKIPLFEVNTGAIARGYRTTPYPSPYLLSELKRLGFGAVVTSDCHDARLLACHFDEAFALLKAHGFSEHYVLTENGFVAEAIE